MKSLEDQTCVRHQKYAISSFSHKMKFSFDFHQLEISCNKIQLVSMDHIYGSVVCQETPRKFDFVGMSVAPPMFSDPSPTCTFLKHQPNPHNNQATGHEKQPGYFLVIKG